MRNLRAQNTNSVLFSLPTIWWLNTQKILQKIFWDSAFDKKKKKPRLKFNPGLALTDVRTTGPRLLVFSSKGINSFKNQVTFCHITTGFPVKWRRGMNAEIPYCVTCHFSDLRSASDWLKQISLVATTRCTTQV